MSFYQLVQFSATYAHTNARLAVMVIIVLTQIPTLANMTVLLQLEGNAEYRSMNLTGLAKHAEDRLALIATIWESVSLAILATSLY